jgi:hypothetical protein
MWPAAAEGYFGATKQGRRRNEAIAEVTLAVATIAMLAAIVAAVRR